MSEEKSKILTMLAEGKISPEEAEKLLDAVPPSHGAAPPETSADRVSLPKNLYIRVEPKDELSKTDRVKITIPVAFIKAGINLLGLLPQKTRRKVEEAINEKGMDFGFNNLSASDKDDFVRVLSELEVDIDTEDSTIKIYTS